MSKPHVGTLEVCNSPHPGLFCPHSIVTPIYRQDETFSKVQKVMFDFCLDDSEIAAMFRLSSKFPGLSRIMVVKAIILQRAGGSSADTMLTVYNNFYRSGSDPPHPDAYFNWFYPVG